MHNMDLTIYPTETPASSGPKLTISQVLSYFETTLKKKNNYVRLVKQYIIFCQQKDYLFDMISYNLYTVGQWPSQKTPIKRFVKFADEHGIHQALPDPPAYSLPPAANTLVLGFLDDAKNLTDGSKETYLKSLNDFFFFLELEAKNNHQSGLSGRGFSGRTVVRYVAWLKKETPARSPCSPFTVSLRLSAVKQLASWIISHRHKIAVPLNAEQLDALRDVAEVRGPRLDHQFHKDGLSETQRETLLSVVDNAKWCAIVALLAYEGLRTIEVTRLQYKDIDFKEMKLWVLGKGQDIKVQIRLFTPCANYLKAYIACLPQGISPNASLFSELNTGQIRYHVGKYLKIAGLKTNRVSAHSLRHTAAQILIAKGVEPMYVQQHLRHKDFSTTQIYVTQQTNKEYFHHLSEDI